jgi:hypothetical protein
MRGRACSWRPIFTWWRSCVRAGLRVAAAMETLRGVLATSFAAVAIAAQT